MLTRFAILPDERRILVGIDKDNLFEPGIVYNIEKVLDTIIIKPIGEYALPKHGPFFPNEYSEVSNIMHSGLHLITKEENEKRTKI